MGQLVAFRALPLARGGLRPAFLAPQRGETEGIAAAIEALQIANRPEPGPEEAEACPGLAEMKWGKARRHAFVY